MATFAGQHSQTPPGDPQWVHCDGKPYYCLDAKQPQRAKGVLSEGNRQDYIRQVGWQGRRRGLGPLGWIIHTTNDPAATWFMALADDSTETTIPNAPTPGKPPPGVK